MTTLHGSEPPSSGANDDATGVGSLDDEILGCGTQSVFGGIGGVAAQAQDVAAGRVVSGSAVRAGSVSQVLYLQQAGDATAISYDDIHQGGLGDCFLLSSIGELALFHPAAITSMIHATGANSEAITLYRAANGALPGFNTSAYRPVTEAVNNSSFSTMGVNSAYSYSQDIVGQQQEIWPQVLEDAAATLNGGYGAIANGGSPVIAMEELTGLQASWASPALMSVSSFITDIRQGDLLVFDTRSGSGLADGLVSGHAYMFKSYNAAANMVQLANPWGFDNPAPISFSKLAQAGIAEIDIGHARG